MVGGETVVAVFAARCALGASATALRDRRDGVWVPTTWAEWQRQAASVAAGLVAAGVAAGDRVALMASPRREWAFVDLGIQMAGAVTVPVYASQTPAQMAAFVSDTAPRVAVVEDLRGVEALVSERARLPALERVFVLDPVRRLTHPDAQGRLELSIEPLCAADERVRDWVRPATALAEASPAAYAEVERRSASIRPDDPCTIIPSSGTTGQPRGVVLTHRNLTAVLGALGELGIGESDEQLLMLPLAHVFGRLLLLGALPLGYVTAFASSPQAVAAEAEEVRPTFLGSAPRLFEKVQDMADSGARASGQVRHGLYRWARQVGGAVARVRRKGGRPEGLLAVQHRYANKLVLGRIRARFGGRVRLFFSGAAPLPRETWSFFEAAGLPILEGYGLTEASGLTTVTRPGHGRPGCVGQPIGGVELRIAADGEILVRGPTVMRGYWNRPEETAAAIDADGWLHTGDIGLLAADGSLTITDRKKDLIVTSGGRNVAPQAIEAEIERFELVAHAVVVGEGRAHLAALVEIDRAALAAWAPRHGLPVDAAPDHPRVRQALERDFAALAPRLAPHERVVGFAILPDELSPARGELTPTGKVNRRAVAARHQERIEALYGEG